MIQSLLDILQIWYHAILDFLRQLHVLHGRVCSVNLTLELSWFLVQIRDNKCHVTEDARVDNGSDSDEAGNEGDLEGASRQDIVAGEKQDGMVQGYEVFVR